MSLFCFIFKCLRELDLSIPSNELNLGLDLFNKIPTKRSMRDQQSELDHWSMGHTRFLAAILKIELVYLVGDRIYSDGSGSGLSEELDF